MLRSLAVALVGVACGGTSLPEAVCNESHPGWAPGTQIFEEATLENGLQGVEGTRLVAVDFDGDGWTDLHVHRGSAGVREEFGADGVRRSWLLRNNQGGGFTDVTESSGIRATRDGEGGRAGAVVAFGDVDNDGDLDVFTGVNDVDGTKTPDTSELLLNQGDGTFVLGPEDAPWRLDADAPAGATFVDFDLDGNLDLWVPRNSVNGAPQQDHLYRGDGTGGFEQVTGSAGLTTQPWGNVSDMNAGLAHSNAWSANACDVDGNGFPDLLAASYGRAPNQLWLNERGAFTNVSVSSGYAFDDDMDYTSNQFFQCWCVANPGGAGCAGAPTPLIGCGTINWRDATDREPYRNGGNSGATSCKDIDNDGDIDLLTGEIQHWWAGSASDEAQVLVNDGTGTFSRPGIEALGMTRELVGTSWDKGDMTNTTLDFDNDGWADLFVGSSDYPGTRSLMWHQDSAMKFSPVAIDDYFDHSRSHGVAAADFDRDGDVDVVVGHSRSRCSGASDCYETSQIRFFDNRLGGNFVQLALEGTGGSNRGAVGARVKVTADGVTQTFEVGGGYGHYGAQNPHVIHAGIGTACEATVEVSWPELPFASETHEITAGHRFRLVRGSDQGPEVLSEDSAP
ncbi:MAG: FG-GAP repeat domain-containing protein [Myxococcota bacterium]